MADTIVNTPAVGSTNDSSIAGWVVALAILAVIVLGALVWARRDIPAPAAPATPAANINVTVPAGSGALDGPAGGSVTQ